MYYVGIEGSISEEEYINYWEKYSPKEWHIEMLKLNEEMDEEKNFDLFIILDEGKEEVGEICEKMIQMKEQNEPLIWVWTTEQNSKNRLVYLRLGADGVTNKEQIPEEWFLMMNNALNRHKKEKNTKHPLLDHSSIREEPELILALNPTNSSVLVEGKTEVDLTRLEYKALSLLLEQPNETVTYEEINMGLWAGKYKEINYRVSNIIFHLRQKLDPVCEAPSYIKTVRGIGYLFYYKRSD